MKSMKFLAKLIDSLSLGLYPCLFHLATGAYCPGCGGTRALVALLQGRITDSIRLNPLVPYMAVSIPAIMMYRLYCLKKGGKMRPLFWMTAVFAGLVLLVVNFIIKNYYLLVEHVDLLALINIMSY